MRSCCAHTGCTSLLLYYLFAWTRTFVALFTFVLLLTMQNTFIALVGFAGVTAAWSPKGYSAGNHGPVSYESVKMTWPATYTSSSEASATPCPSANSTSTTSTTSSKASGMPCPTSNSTSTYPSYPMTNSSSTHGGVISPVTFPSPCPTSANTTWTTEIVTEYTTYCPAPTQVTMNNKTCTFPSISKLYL